MTILRKFIIVLILLYTGCADKHLVFLNKCPNRIVEVKKLEHYKGYITINDSLSIPAAYFSRDWTGLDDYDMAVLKGNLHVKDTLLLGPNPEKYVVRKRKGIETRFAIGEFRNLEFDK